MLLKGVIVICFYPTFCNTFKSELDNSGETNSDLISVLQNPLPDLLSFHKRPILTIIVKVILIPFEPHFKVLPGYAHVVIRDNEVTILKSSYADDPGTKS